MAAVILPHRYWHRFPAWMAGTQAAFLSGIATILLGAAIGIPGFLAHASVNVSLANTAMLDPSHDAVGYNRGYVQGFSGLSIFSFLLLTPAGWTTIYLLGSGTLRAAAGWFDDPVGDPLLTGIDRIAFGGMAQRRVTR